MAAILLKCEDSLSEDAIEPLSASFDS